LGEGEVLVPCFSNIAKYYYVIENDGVTIVFQWNWNFSFLDLPQQLFWKK
jgi:hypothetical protein